MMRKPMLGWVVRVTEGYDEDQKQYTGKVTQLLSTQFVYITNSGETRFCFYSQAWEDTEEE